MTRSIVVFASLAACLAVAPLRSADDASGASDGPRWVTIPAGRFSMGCVPADKSCRPDEKPRREAELSRPYQLTATEITVGQFDAFSRRVGGRTPRQPSWNDSPRHPVVNITWEEAAAVCDGLGGRLPTEAEWERAARGGVEDQTFPWGMIYERRHTNAVGRGDADRWLTTAPVGSFSPNAYGLYDMAGNVWEWTADWYGRYEKGPVRDPTGPPTGTRKVIRGGSWDSSASRLRSSMRMSLPTGARYNLYVGVRCAQ